MISRILGGVSAILLLLLTIQTARMHHWHAAYDKLHGQASVVMTALQSAVGHKVDWATAPGEIIAMGETVRSQRVAITETNQRIDDMAREAVRLKAKAAELKNIADRAEAQRRSALVKLSDMAATPGTRADCMILLSEADAALNLVRSASQ